MMLRGRRVDADTVGAYLRWRRWTHRYANLRTPRFFTGAGSTLVIGGRASVAIGEGFVTGRQFTGVWFGDLHIGRDVFFNESCHLATFAAVTIGDGCLFGEKVSIHDENHRFGPEYDDDPRTIPARGLDSRPIVVGDRVWVGAKATVLGGAVIGDDAVIGAHAVVTGTIPPRTLAVGIPARPVRSW